MINKVDKKTNITIFNQTTQREFGFLEKIFPKTIPRIRGIKKVPITATRGPPRFISPKFTNLFIRIININIPTKKLMKKAFQWKFNPYMINSLLDRFGCASLLMIKCLIRAITMIIKAS